mmetsp:Transcript_63116/g.150472  ORF Transcript_63116/g.150472 Transcript_63116/m.150472 type:complete len:222 (-) Transcript_63116:176-841(-)|eukprot:CAMPEP_0178402512 /NCGR_PEP_ID=MMETSP0689_2-20121128/16881_1 /TAXON_ID=160604 /ORGANISM="Amphidinium massartii, Strain CS-259" /LENGTH=221 /DNA_ID=CAMNT_0020023417 /DNA_START=189 /DNA_END=854 /DNA_ORIENTATION=+
MVEVRQLTSADFRESEEVTREAFWNHFQPGADEHFIAHALRESTDYLPELDLGAFQDGKLIGNIVYSKSKISTSDGREISDVVTFGPFAVLPEHRKCGIGAKLVMESLRRAKEMGFRAVIIYGDPRLYGRLGFRCGERYDLTNGEGQYCIALMVYPLYDGAMDGLGGTFSESEVFQTVTEEAVAEFDAAFPPKEKGTSDFQSEFAVMLSLCYAKDSKYQLG